MAKKTASAADRTVGDAQKQSENSVKTSKTGVR